MDKTYKYFIAAHFRSGTRFVALSLWDRSLRVGHERMGADGICSWCHVGEGEVPWLSEPVKKYKFEKVIHLVRHPLSCISSCAMQKPKDPSHRFISQNIPGLPEVDDTVESKLVFFTRSWVAWNRKIENEWDPGIRVRLECIKDEWGKWLQYIGPPLIHDMRPLHIPRIVPHATEHPTLRWSVLEALDKDATQAARDMAEEYKYE